MSLWEDLFYALDTPGALFRGVLAGRPGERVSGRELIGAEPGTLLGEGLGLGADLLLDPLNLLGAGAIVKGVKGLRGGRAARAGLSAAEELPTTLLKIPKTGKEVDRQLDVLARRQGFAGWDDFRLKDPNLEHYGKSPAFAQEADRLENIGSRLERGLPPLAPSVPPVKARNLATGQDEFFRTWEEARDFVGKNRTQGDWRIMYSDENFTSWGQRPQTNVSQIVGHLEGLP